MMDDDVALRSVTERMLVRLGYTVTSVSDSEAAVQAYQAALAADTRFDLVILDLTIPGGKGGVETLELLLALDSTVRAVAATGYSNAPVVAERGKYGFVGALWKPFSMLELSQMVNAQLLH
jgi:CheY-like chemotaxis protein